MYASTAFGSVISFFDGAYHQRNTIKDGAYDTWHGKSCKFCISFYSFIGTKNVAKAMTKIATGAKMRAGITWFPELSGKSEE